MSAMPSWSLMRRGSDGERGLPSDVQAAIETRFSQVEETPRKNQKQHSQWQGDSVKDAQAIETYLTQVHTMVTELHHFLWKGTSRKGP